LLRYMVEQWYDLEKKGTLGSKLPPVFPILIYHGEKAWTSGVHFHDIVNIPHDDMKPYIPNFQYFLSDATTEDEDKYKTSVVIKCWFIVVKYIKDPVMREKLFEVVRLLHDRLEQDTAVEYVEEGMLSDAREMVLEALDIRFSSNVPGDVHKKINTLNNRILLKKLLGSAIQSKDIDGFRKIIQELTPDPLYPVKKSLTLLSSDDNLKPK